jgi:hypothetical protein
MKKSRYSEEQIIGVLKQMEAGRKVAELARELGVSEATLYTWKSKYGGSGRLTAVQYKGGGTAGLSGGPCGTTFTEMYTYNSGGAKLGKRLRIQRQAPRGAPYNDSVTLTQDLNSTYAYDNEGKMTSQQYPLSGPNVGYAYDTTGRLNTMGDQGTQNNVISTSTYNPAGQL